MTKIQINFDQVNNFVDLANYLKYVLRAKVSILPEEKSGIAFVAHTQTSHVFVRAMPGTEMIVFVFLNQKVRIFFHDNPLIHMCFVSLEDLEKTDAKFTAHSFETLQGFIDFIQPETLSIEFPEIDIDDIREIDLSQREKALKKWREVLEKLIPYGVLVENQIDEYVTDASWVFQIQLPVKPVPKELALKNEYLDEYHYEYDNDHLISFGDPKYNGNWNQNYKKIISHLKKLYAFEEFQAI